MASYESPPQSMHDANGIAHPVQSQDNRLSEVLMYMPQMIPD